MADDPTKGGASGNGGPVRVLSPLRVCVRTDAKGTMHFSLTETFGDRVIAEIGTLDVGCVNADPEESKLVHDVVTACAAYLSRLLKREGFTTERVIYAEPDGVDKKPM